MTPTATHRFLHAVAVALLALPLFVLPAQAGEALLDVQGALQERGYYRGPLDGLMGPETRSAVRAFQRDHDLAVDGIPGPQVRATLGRLGGQRRQAEDRNRPEVLKVQKRLFRFGYYHGPIDGVIGPETRDAIAAYQRDHGFTPDGRLGVRFLTDILQTAANDIRTGAGDEGDQVCVRGRRSDEGVECPAFRALSGGTLYTLTGDTDDLGDGPACVCGAPVDMSFCQQGTTLEVRRVGQPSDCAQ